MGLEPKQARQPKAPSRYGVYGVAHAVNERYLFGTDAEINDRVATGYVTNVAEVPPHFVQISAGPTSRNVNEPSFNGASKSVGRPYVGNPRRFA